MPTVLDVLNLPLQANLDGVSAFDSQRPDRGKVFYAIPNEGEPGEKVSYIEVDKSDIWRKVESID